MFVSNDYKGAASYFSRLDKKLFPESEDYLALCRLQASFTSATDEAERLAGRLFSEVAKRAPSKNKYENMIFIASCYENFDPDPDEGLKKSLSVLKIAKGELGSKPDEEFTDILQRIDDLIFVKERRIKQKKQGGKDE